MTGPEFRTWRTSQGWSQSACAHVLMISRQAIVFWENGRTPVPDSVSLVLQSVDAFRSNRVTAILAEFKLRIAKADAWPRRGRRWPKPNLKMAA